MAGMKRQEQEKNCWSECQRLGATRAAPTRGLFLVCLFLPTWTRFVLRFSSPSFTSFGTLCIGHFDWYRLGGAQFTQL